MMKFGLYLRGVMVELIDMETGEVLAETASGVQAWLTAYPKHTLQLL